MAQKIRTPADRGDKSEPHASSSARSGHGFRGAFGVVAAALVLFAGAAQSPAALKLSKGNHVVFLGNALADRMQHDGWVETYIQASNPTLQLVIRNQGFSGDKVDKRPRNRGFPNPDEYLKLSQADVIFAFWGYNESYDDNPGDFKNKLNKWIDETNGKQYNSGSAPRIVLFSPIAHEDLNDPNLPDGTKNNRRLAAYTKAMAEVARAKRLPFVDLFTATKRLYAYARANEPLTLNGVHMTAEGNRQLAQIIAKALFGRLPSKSASQLAKIRAAVLDKNLHWYNRYRATDGNDVWGGRSRLKFTDGQSNRVVLQQELKMFDAMTANRDKVIWAANAGRTLRANDSNVPKPILVKTNLRSGKQRNKIGTANFISGEATAEQFKLARGLQAQLFADEKRFPELVNPVQLGVDTQGRLWAAAWKTYPKWEPMKKMEDRLLIFPDKNRDGRADRAITFAKVHNPTGFEFWNGGVIVISAPDILFLKDTDGDDKEDVRIHIFQGIDSADTHHTANNLVYGPGGWIYYQRGVFHVSNVETPWTRNQQSGKSAMYRFNPRTYEFSYHAGNSPNPHGISFGYWGYHYATDGTGGRAYQVRPDGRGGFRMRGLLKKQVRPVCSSGPLSSTHFPPEMQGNFLICNAIGFLGIKQYKLTWKKDDQGNINGDVWGVPVEEFMSSPDRNFRPTDFEVAGDGAVYVSDWSNAIIGHMQHNIRDPHRDHIHGRIYRITYRGRPLMRPIKIDGQPVEALLDLLKHPVNRIRQHARIELSEHDTKKVIAATKRWMRQFNPKKQEDAHHLMEALWVHQQFNVVNRTLLQQMLSSPEPHARIAAKTVEQFWRNKK